MANYVSIGRRLDSGNLAYFVPDAIRTGGNSEGGVSHARQHPAG